MFFRRKISAFIWIKFILFSIYYCICIFLVFIIITLFHIIIMKTYGFWNCSIISYSAYIFNSGRRIQHRRLVFSGQIVGRLLIFCFLDRIHIIFWIYFRIFLIVLKLDAFIVLNGFLGSIILFRFKLMHLNVIIFNLELFSYFIFLWRYYFVLYFIIVNICCL